MTKSTPNGFNFTWGSQKSHILEGLKALAVGEVNSAFLTDVTLACEGEYIETHRLVLSLCSSFFKQLFNQNERISDKAHGIVILSHVSARDLRYMLQFMYQGAVQVPREHVDSFLQAGSLLKVEGLISTARVALGTSDKVSGARAPSKSSSANPCPKTSRPSPSVSSLKRRRISGSASRIDDNNVGGAEATTKELSDALVTLCGDDDDGLNPVAGEVVLDDFGDAGCDSDFGGGPSEYEGIGTGGVSLNPLEPEPSTSKIKSEKTVTPKQKGKSVGRRRNNDSNSSSDDDDDGTSSDSSDSTINYLDCPGPKPKLKLNYELSKRFQNIDEAKAFVNGEKKWAPHGQKTLSTNEKKYIYSCLFERECPVRMYLLEWDTKTDLYITTEEHSHTHMAKIKKIGLSEEVKERVKQLFVKGIKKPQRVLMALKAEGFEEPKSSQIGHYIYRLSKMKNVQ
ncbi:unnamed protein product [Orchesella dallaii]|uniref:BTB domain-containing protein n=1 Tax=Orchesella dallaii TaxID=48710 RepID=A0ABP1QMQ1_9HEXA